MNLASTFLENLRLRRDKVGLVWKSSEYSFEEIHRRAMAVRSFLAQRGIKRGDRVAILLPNCPDLIFAHIGAILSDAIRVPVNPKYTSREAAHVIRTTGASIVLTDREHFELTKESGGVPALAQEAAEAKSPAEVSQVQDDDITMICFTSGTTNKPKGVPLSHENMCANINGLVEAWEWKSEDTLLLCLPMTHLHGLGNGLNGWFVTGCRMVLTEKFQPEQVLETIQRDRCTMFFGVPAMYTRLVDVDIKKFDLSSMRIWVTGSAPLDAALQERFAQKFGRQLCNRYGMSETIMITANTHRGEKRIGSVGRALPGMDVRVVDAASFAELPDGQIGEIVVRGGSVMKGYWGGEVDAATCFKNEFFRTGDLGYRDKDGYFFITGRAKDIIISGGTNISPLEIEEVLLAHPAVLEAAVIGVPDSSLGEALKAIIVSKGRLSESDILEWCEKRLAKFKRPRQIVFASQPLPRNNMQKLDRKQIRNTYGQE